MKKLLLIASLFCAQLLLGQSNISLSNAQALPIFQANYNPATYAASNPISAHDQIICELQDRVSPDTLQAYLEKLGSYYTRHTWSDTISDTAGIGAARRWVFQKFNQFSQRNESRLISSYLIFDVIGNTCGNLYGTKNVLGVLPGTDTANEEIIIIEAHMDSRCAGRCDSACEAQGIDDNGSGTALVLELARVMSRYSYDRTIVFMATTGEEQGLLGADAKAQFAQDNNIPIKAVQNNDIVGGVICGNTSSPPGCNPPGSVDSTNLRIYANPVSYLYPHQSFARSVKMFYEEKLRPNSPVKMNLNVQGQEDRTGRGGDHIPFRQRGYRNLRFTSSHEHGNGDPSTPGYEDRQHTSDDILGVDTNGDNEIDSFFVDMNYLARNVVINAMSASLIAQGPDVPEFTLHDEPTGLRVEITSPQTMPEYRVGVRNGNQTHFDEVYSFSGNSFLIPGQTSGQFYYISVAAIDSNGIMSPFSTEERQFSQASTPAGTPATLKYGINCNLFGSYERPVAGSQPQIILKGCQPNPFRESTEIVMQVNELPSQKASLVIADQSGRLKAEIPLELKLGENRVKYEHKGAGGFLVYTLKVGERIVHSRKMLVK